MSSHPQEVPPEEEEILNYFLDVRNFLSRLKQDRAQYLNSSDISTTYQNVLTEVRKLDKIRKSSHTSPSNSVTALIHSDKLHNRVDSVLDDVFQLLSLSFLTVGLKNSAPATYASLSTVQRLLEHLNESNVYTHHDLRPIRERLLEISEIVEKNNYIKGSTGYECGIDYDSADRDLNERSNKIEDLLLRAKLNYCLDAYHKMESKLEEIHPDLQSCMEKLFQIRRGVLSLVASSKVDNNTISVLNKNLVDEKLKVLESELSVIESNRDVSGKFISLETGKVEEKGQNVLNGLLDDCRDLINDLSHQISSGSTLDSDLQPIYDELIEIKTTLENLLVTRRWTLRETDLFTYQKKLGDIDSLRVKGKFPTKSGNDSRGQFILLYLLRRCYAIIYKLLESSEPVSEALQRVHNQLSTVRRCLLELKRMGGVNNERELYPYEMKLASLDNMRIDGKFYDADGNIPEGQGTLNALLAECFDITHELKIEAEQRKCECDKKSESCSNNTIVEMTKDSSMRDVSEDHPSPIYLDTYKHDHKECVTNYSDHSYEDEDYTTISCADD